MTNKVDTHHPAYDRQQMKRNDFLAVAGGTDAMRECKEKCLPKYPGEAQADYDARLAAATIDGLVAAGIDTLTGKVFAEPVKTDKVNSALQPFLDNFDNEGTPFNDFARKAFEASFDGFALIVADLPPENIDMAKAREVYGAEADVKFNIRPYARIYRASSVVNWHYITNPINHVKELTLLVLEETTDELGDDGFSRQSVTRYRVYRQQGGVVTWELWKKKKNTVPGQPAEFEKDGGGVVSRVTEIPAAFIGHIEDDPKLLAEARLELRAYQKESSFDVIEYLSIPIFYTVGYPEDAPSLTMSASTHLRLPAGNGTDKAAVGFAQIDSKGHESLKGTISQIKDIIKQRLSQTAETQTRAVDKTATETLSEAHDRTARLVVWADELKYGFKRTLYHMARMVGQKDGGEIELVTAWDKAEPMRQADNAIVVEADQQQNNDGRRATATRG